MSTRRKQPQLSEHERKVLAFAVSVFAEEWRGSDNEDATSRQAAALVTKLTGSNRTRISVKDQRLLFVACGVGCRYLEEFLRGVQVNGDKCKGAVTTWLELSELQERIGQHLPQRT